MSHQHQLELLMARDLAAQGRAMDHGAEDDYEDDKDP